MNSTLNPDAVLTARADERLAHAYEQIARADDQLTRVTERLSRMEHDTHRSGSFGGSRGSRDRPVLRGLVGLVLAGCIGAAAFAWQSPYGGAARSMISEWAPSLVSTSPAWSAKPAGAATGAATVQATAPSPVQLAAVEPIPVQATPPAQAPQDAASTPAPTTPELTQMLQAMARDIATMQQGIAELKANQERMAADNARAIEQLKASQEQMAHLVAKPSAPPKPPPTPAPRPVAGAAHKPPPAAPPQARAHPQPIQLQPQEQ